jgi:hypothetical protein
MLFVYFYNITACGVNYFGIVSLDSPSCEVPCWILRSVVHRDVTRQTNSFIPFEVRGSPSLRTRVLEPV